MSNDPINLQSITQAHSLFGGPYRELSSSTDISHQNESLFENPGKNKEMFRQILEERLSGYSTGAIEMAGFML